SAAPCCTAKSQQVTISAAIVPARLPYRTAQARTGPAIHVAVTGSAPRTVASGYCRTWVLSSRPAVTTRSAPSSTRVRRPGRRRGARPSPRGGGAGTAAAAPPHREARPAPVGRSFCARGGGGDPRGGFPDAGEPEARDPPP